MVEPSRANEINMSITLYGVNLSPYVRKVCLTLAHKGLDYQHIPVIPSSDQQPTEFKQNSPLGKIPLLHIDDIFIADSAVILAYLERSRPQSALLSDDPKLAAKALWFEEYSGSTMVSVINGHLFAELILAPNFFNRESNLEEIELAKSKELPDIFDYLESQLYSDYLIGDEFGHADLCVGASLVSLQHCDIQCDANQWPKTAAYIDRVVGSELFAPVIADEKAFMASVMD